MRGTSAAGLALLTIGLVLWVATLLLGWIDLPRLVGALAYRLHVFALSLPALLMGSGLFLTSAGQDRSTDWRAPVLIVVLIALAALLVAAVLSKAISPVIAAVILVLAAVTLIIAFQALDSLREGGGVSFDSNWGGLGGGLGGWRLSPTAVHLALLLVFASTLVAVALYTPGKETATKDTAPPATAGPAGKTATPPAAKPGAKSE